MEKRNYEQKLHRLEEVVGMLRAGKLELNDSVKLYEEGLRLYRECKEELNEMDMKLKQMVDGEETDLPIGEQDEEGL